MIRAACHCGAVRFEIAEPPAWVLDFNCTICRRYGAMWSYHHAGPDQAKLLKTPDAAATEAPEVARRDGQAMAPRRRRDDQVGQSGRLTLTAGAVGQSAGDAGGRRVQGRMRSP